MSQYRSFNNLEPLPLKVMEFIINWVNVEKTPVPKKQIFFRMQEEGYSIGKIRWALDVLLAKGYIRRGYSPLGNTTTYVQLRGL